MDGIHTHSGFIRSMVGSSTALFMHIPFVRLLGGIVSLCKPYADDLHGSMSDRTCMQIICTAMKNKNTVTWSHFEELFKEQTELLFGKDCKPAALELEVRRHSTVVNLLSFKAASHGPCAVVDHVAQFLNWCNTLPQDFIEVISNLLLRQINHHSKPFQDTDQSTATLFQIPSLRWAVHHS